MNNRHDALPVTIRPEIIDALAGITVTAPVTREASGAVRAVFAPFHETEPYAGLTVTRDEYYGTDERHRLDVFAPEQRGVPLPVMIFVHGGAYVRGDKREPGSPFHDNVALWAARNGFIGVNMTYRLAPANKYPAGAADVGAAIGWLRANIARFGGDPEKITLVGHSAGATHAACYVARPDLYAGADAGIDGVALMAGNYDFTGPNPGEPAIAYFGEDPQGRAAAGCIAGVVTAKLPVLIVISERDSLTAHRQSKMLADALFERDGRNANFVYLPHHNHISILSHLNAPATGDRILSAALADFITTCAARSAQTAGSR